MKPSRQLVDANAKQLHELHVRVKATAKRRYESVGKRGGWEAACQAFHGQFDNLFFPGGAAMWQAFVVGERSALEAAVVFLEADQHTFRSGYHKQTVWHRLKRAELNPRDRARLEVVAESYLARRVGREFWDMATYVRHHGSPEFWLRVESLARERTRSPANVKAGWLLLSMANLPVRKTIQSQVRRASHDPTFSTTLDLVQFSA